MTEDELLHVAADVATDLAPFLTESLPSDELFALLDEALATLAATGVWGPANKLASARFWEICGEQLRHGELLLHARTKPRGYAGDDEMLRKMCEQVRCVHPLGRRLDDYFLAHAAPRAVRYRTLLVAGEIINLVEGSSAKQVRVTSVGSGPALDLFWAAQALTEHERARLRVTLLDLDPQALEAARARLERFLSPEQVVAARENLYRLPRRKDVDELLSADLIACTGFFDYLTDADAASLLATLWRHTQPGGKLLVFNFAPHNPSRALMEWIGNWYLTYRDTAAMHALARAAALPEDGYTVQAEATGADLYIHATREESGA